MSAALVEESNRAPRRRVYILARKILVQNTRIFKQAHSLTRAGYDVTLIGILPRGGAPLERRDGYRIIRVALDPLYARVPRRIRRAARTVNRVLIRMPFRYVVKVLGTRLVIHRAFSRARRAVHMTAFDLRARYRVAHGSVRRLIDADPRRRLARLRLLRRWQITRYRLSTLGADDAGQRLDPGPPWKRALFLPVLIVARSLRLLGRAMQAATLGLQQVRERRLGYALLRWFVRFEERVLRLLTEYAVKLVRTMMRPFAWPLKSLDFYRRVHRIVTTELQPPDVIHANDLDTLWVASVLARRYDVPLVYDAQELYTGIHTLPRLYRAALVLQERVLIRRAQRTIAVNDAIRDEMERRYKVKIDAVVLNCPPLVEDLGDGSLTVRQLLDLPDDMPVLLYSGSLGPQRGLENTMRALEHLEHACLVLLGDGPLRTDLEEQAVDWGLDDRVFFVPFIHHLDVPSFIASANIGIIPYENVGVNHYLCSPSKLFHYIMAGLPVACSDFPFLRRVVLDNGIGAVFDPGDPLAIAGAVHRLTDAPDAYRACKQRLELARKRYCWEEQETLFMSVYRSLPMHALTVPATSVRVGAA